MIARLNSSHATATLSARRGPLMYLMTGTVTRA